MLYINQELSNELFLLFLFYYRDPGGSSYRAEATLFCDNVVSNWRFLIGSKTVINGLNGFGAHRSKFYFCEWTCDVGSCCLFLFTWVFKASHTVQGILIIFVLQCFLSLEKKCFKSSAAFSFMVQVCQFDLLVVASASAKRQTAVFFAAWFISNV